jgi:hypothetical protein
MTLIGLALSLLAGCPAPGPASVKVGTGELSFSPLTDGDDVEVVLGPQGGYHIYGSMQVTGIDPGNPDSLGDPSNPTVAFAVFDGEDRLDRGAVYTQGLDESEERGVYEMIGRLLILDITDDDEVVGHTFDVEVYVQDVDGVEVTDAVSVTAIKAPTNP